MRCILILLLTTITAFGAEDAWAKVRELKSGTELRVYKTGAKQPLLVKMDEANADGLMVATKNEQITIQKADIDRIDFRPPQTTSRVTKQTKTTATEPDIKPPNAGGTGSVPGQSTSTGLSIGSKPGFETIYRRMPVLAPK